MTDIANPLPDASAVALGAATGSGSAGWAIARLEQPPPESGRPDLIYIDTDRFESVCITVAQAVALSDALYRVTGVSKQATLAATPADEGHIAAARQFYPSRLAFLRKAADLGMELDRLSVADIMELCRHSNYIPR